MPAIFDPMDNASINAAAPTFCITGTGGSTSGIGWNATLANALSLNDLYWDYFFALSLANSLSLRVTLLAISLTSLPYFAKSTIPLRLVDWPVWPEATNFP